MVVKAPVSPEDLYNRYMDACCAKEDALRRFLSAAGFVYTCELESLWLWKKVVNGKLLYLSEAHSVRRHVIRV